jgi:hypothetical protein
LYDIAPADRIEQIIKNVFDQPYANLFTPHRAPLWKDQTAAVLDEDVHVIMAEPFFMHHVNQTFAKLGFHDQIVRYLVDGWAKMLDLGATTIWETWDDGGSLCHAWCTTPAYDLATHCLGAQIVAPGATRVLIAPHPMGLTWAEGTVPTAQGLVHVRWEWDDTNRQLLVQWVAPLGILIECQAPAIEGMQPVDAANLGSDGGWVTRMQYTY